MGYTYTKSVPLFIQNSNLDILYFYLLNLATLAICLLWIHLSIFEREQSNERESHSSWKRGGSIEAPIPLSVSMFLCEKTSI